MNGYRPEAGQYIPVRAPAETLARMAQVVGVTPEQLEQANRADAAAELRELPPLATSQFDENIATAHALLDAIEQDPQALERLRRILGAAGSGRPAKTTERDKPDTDEDPGTSLTG